MQLTYLGALVIAGWFTFMPGRIMNQVVFGPEGGSPMQSVAFLAASILGGAAILLLLRRPIASPSLDIARPGLPPARHCR